MKPSHLIGLVLWRAGLLLAGSWALYRVGLALLRWVELPGEVTVGGSLILAGAALVVLSVVLERARDARREGAVRG